MTPEQITRLRALTEKLADAFLAEDDQSLWSGGEQPVAELTTQERGDRYWCKKNAIATAAVLNATLLMIQQAAPSHRRRPARGWSRRSRRPATQCGDIVPRHAARRAGGQDDEWRGGSPESEQRRGG